MRRHLPLCLVLALLALATAGRPAVAADQAVAFASATAVPSRVGAGSLPRAGTIIRGYLAKPRGDGPFPAVVVLHSCLGLRADRQAVEGMLAGWGYVSLLVDDFGTRGIRETCAVDFPEGLSDAVGALAFVAGLPYVDKTRIAALGYSQGANTALQVASLRFATSFAVPPGVSFKAVAAFYPPCENQLGVRLQLPTLILIGAADTVTPAAQCRRLVASQPAADVRLLVYPGAGHVFDDPAFAGGKRVLGMWLQYNGRAAARSEAALHEFLAASLGR